MQEFLLRIRRSVLEEAVVEFDIVGKSYCTLYALRMKVSHTFLHYSPTVSFEILGSLSKPLRQRHKHVTKQKVNEQKNDHARAL